MKQFNDVRLTGVIRVECGEDLKEVRAKAGRGSLKHSGGTN